MITIDHNHHPSSPQNSKHNNIIHDHKILDWNDINPAGDGTDFLSSALGVDPIDINPDSLDDDFSSFINETSLASRPATPVKPTEGIEDISPLGDRSSSLSPPPDTVSPAPVTGTTLAGEENEEGESGEPQREEEEEDEEENVNGATASKDENQEHEGKKEEEQQQFLSTTDSLGSPLSELSPPPDQDDDEPAQPEQEEEPQTSPSTRPQETNKVSKPESTKSLSTTVAQPASGVSGSSGDATSSTASKNGLPASNAVTPMAGSSSNMGAMSGLSTSNQFPHPRVDGMQSMQGSVPHPAGPSTTDARVTTILELNNELFKIGAEFQAKGLIPGDERWTQFSTRMQSNLTWLAASADQRNTVASLPIMAPPPPVDFYSMERILQIYAELPRLFAKDIARRQTSQHAPSSAGPLMGMGLGAGAPTTPVHPVTPSLKRDRPVDDVQGAGDMNALKRRNTGSAMDGAMMPPPSTSPTNPRPPSAASNHSQPPNSVSISSPLSAGPGSTGHTSPPSSSNGLPGSISAPGSFPRSTPTPAPGQTPSAPHSSSTSPRQQTPSLSGLSGHELAEAQAAANNRERVRQQQIREAQMRAHQQAQQQAQQQAHAREQQAREAQQKQQMAARQMSGTPGTPGNPMSMGATDASASAGMSMNGMPGAHNPAGASSIGSGLAPSEIQRQLLTVLQTPNHPMVLYMHRMDPNFGNLPIQTQMQKMWATQNMMKQQQQQRQNQQNQQGFPNPGGNPNPMSQMSSPPNPHAQQKPSGLGQNSFPSIGVTPSSPAPPQSPAIPQLAGGGGMNMFGLDSPANQNAAGGQGAGGGIDPRLLPPGMNINNMTPLQRQQLLMMQQQQQAARGGSGTPNPMGMGMGGAGPGGMGGPSGMGGLGGGMGGNTQNMMSMMNPQQQMMQQQQQEQRMREQRQQQQQMAMGMGMPSRDGGVNPGLMAGPSIARSARSPSDTVPNPMTPRMPQQHLAPGTGMSRPPTSEEYSRLMQQQAAQAAQAQRVLSARSPSNFNPQQAGGAGPGGWQGQQQQGMNMGMNIGGGGMGMGMGMNPQQQQNAGAGYGMSPPGSAGGMYTGASSPTGGNQGPMWSSTANVDHASQMRHMSGTPGPQQPQNMGPSMMDSSIPSELDLFSSWTQ